MEIIEEKTTVRELINRMGVLDPDRMVEATIREPKDEAQGDRNSTGKQKAFQAILDIEPSEGTNPKSAVELLREIRESE
ncbi:MAG: hypothetical protein GY849_06590 [Deltaproteobacteria bacterium]|nr:hypothetical protein [Deltaproteobacteria bacterium]